MAEIRSWLWAMVIVLTALLIPPAATAEPAAPIEPELLVRLRAEGRANYFVKMAIEADLSAAYGMEWEARGEYVWNALKAVAQTSQAPVLAACMRGGLDCTSMLTTNAVFVRSGTLADAELLAGLPGVAYLRLERVLRLPDPPSSGGASIHGSVGALTDPGGITAGLQALYSWGIRDVNADDVWALGYQGAGIKVAGIDTGVQWNHPALDQAFACPGNPSDPACWKDPSNICGGSACDNNGHGTHTMGTMVADDDPSLPYIAGMAPDAVWIACKGCEADWCSDYALNTCADWILAPGGNTANRPHVVNNSWGSPGGDPWYLPKVNAWRAAGIFPAFSAGNDGSACETLTSPGDYQESLATAAYDSWRVVAPFSSRGPGEYGHDPYTKPNLTAPGVNICSALPGNGWSCGYSGTSMASPHTAGAVALIWSACPALKGQMGPTFELLQNNADAPPAGNCGAPPDGQGNYTFGYGYLNVLKAVQACAPSPQKGTLRGYVRDASNAPIQGATVRASDGTSGTTDASGFYSMELAPGTYSATASKPGYTPDTASGIVIVQGQTVSQNFGLYYLGAWTQAGSLCFDWTRFDGEYHAGTGKVYFLGGRSGADTVGDIYSLDPATLACADTGANMITAISNYTIARLTFSGTEMLCTFGGRDSTGNATLKVQCFEPVTRIVLSKADLPGAFSGYVPGGVEVVNNKAYIFGGFRSTAAPYEIAVTYEYNPATNSYTARGNLSLARGYLMTAVVDGYIYAFGGTIFDGTNLVAQTRAERFDPAAGLWSDEAVADLPLASAEGRGFGFDTGSAYGPGGWMVLAGGGQWPNETAEALVYRVGGNQYEYDFPDLNVMRRDHAGFFVPGSNARIWVVGGRSSAPGYGGDNPPHAPGEWFHVLFLEHRAHLPLVLRQR